MERKEQGPEPEAPGHSDPAPPAGGGIDLSQVDDEVSVLVRKRHEPKQSAQKPGSRLAAFLRASNPQSNKPQSNKPQSNKPQSNKPQSNKSQPNKPQPNDVPAQPALAGVAQASAAEQGHSPAKAKTWPPRRSEKTSPAAVQDHRAEPPTDLEPPARTPTDLEPPARTPTDLEPPAPVPPSPNTTLPAAKLWPPTREDASPPSRHVAEDKAPAASQAANSAQPEAAPAPSPPKDPDQKTSPLADYLPPGLRKSSEQSEANAASWPPPRETQPKAPGLQTDPQDIPEVTAGPIKAANNPKSLMVPEPSAARTPLRSRANTIKDKLGSTLGKLFKRNTSLAMQSEIEAGLSSPSQAPKTAPKPESPSQESSLAKPAASSREQDTNSPGTVGPSRAPAPSLRTYPFSPIPPSQEPAYPTGPVSQPAPERPPSSLAPPEPAQVPAAFVRTKPRTPLAPPEATAPASFVKTNVQAPTEPEDSGLGTFRRRQSPPQTRLRKQHSYRHTAPESTLGLRWWYHHWSAVTWLGRSLWIGAFVCAWIALSRCLDPAVSDPKLSQVPYVALLGWLLCAGLAFNQRIPSRFRWTGLLLGAANSIALALSWSFRLDQL